MKLDKLLKQLKRDAAKSPQKAGVLALMVLVALYFWAPLVMKRFQGKAKPGAGPSASLVILRDDPLVAKAAAHPATNVAHWDRVRQAVTNDRLMLAVAHDPSWPNPFAGLQTGDSSPAKKQPGETKVEPKPLPAAPKIQPEVAKQQLAGVNLTSLLMSKRGHAAVIGGKVYRVGDILELGGESGEPAAEMRITAIDDEGVHLDFDGQRYRLERAKPKLSSGEDLQPD